MFFHEVLESDLENTFLAIDEFASEHRVNGVLMQCVIDDRHDAFTTGVKNDMGNASGLGLLECERLMFCAHKSFTEQATSYQDIGQGFGQAPIVGERIHIDGIMWTVERIVLHEGLLEIGLNRAY